jgi:DNA replication licensing factor MCM3
MRSKQSARNLPVTARSLETIIRLASAHAKSRLSNSVDEVDVEEVLDILNFVMFHEIGKDHEASDSRVNTMNHRESKRKAEGDGEVGDTSNDDDEDDDGNMLLKRTRVEDEEIDEEVGDSLVDVDRDSSRYQRVLEVVHKLGSSGDGHAVAMEIIQDRLNQKPADGSRVINYSTKELTAILIEMERENKIMFDDGEVHIM